MEYLSKEYLQRSAEIIGDISSRLPAELGDFMEGLFFNSAKVRKMCKVLKESNFTTDEEKKELDSIVDNFARISHNAFNQILDEVVLKNQR